MPKLTVCKTVERVTEESVFNMLDSLQRTFPGPDNLPFWFLRVLAPFLAKPLSQIYNLSINKSFIPEQWKCSTITPVAKVARPTVCAEYRPISVTPIMSRLLEKVIVQDYIYPALIHPACTHLFHDQFAFRPTGSTTAALVSLIHKNFKSAGWISIRTRHCSWFFESLRYSSALNFAGEMRRPAYWGCCVQLAHEFSWQSNTLYQIYWLHILFEADQCKHCSGLWHWPGNLRHMCFRLVSAR